jgi:hypothetical protein
VTKPNARRKGLLVTSLRDETLVYDLESHRAHCLGPTLTSIWQACDGARSVADITVRLNVARLKESGEPVDRDVVALAIQRLRKARLLQPDDTGVAVAGKMLRREVLRRATALGGLSIISMIAPTVAQAASCLPTGTCVDNHCQDSLGRVCCAGSGACLQNSQTCGTGKFGFQCS